MQWGNATLAELWAGCFSRSFRHAPNGRNSDTNHMYEAIIYVMKGSGAPIIWLDAAPKRTVEVERRIAVGDSTQCMVSGVQCLE